MARPAPPAKQQKTSWTDVGLRMMAAQQFRSALEAFATAAQAEKTVGVHRYNMAIAHSALGEIGPAAEQLCEALRLRPGMVEAAEMLGALLGDPRMPATVRLNRNSLKAALDFDRINRDQIAEAAVYYLARHDPLKAALDLGRKDGFLTAARHLVLKSTADLLKDDLLLKSLADSIIRMPDLELLLGALRRVLLLELPPERLQDKALVAFVVALMRQCGVNEYVWVTTGEEDSALAASPVDLDRLVAGDIEQGFKLLLYGLYGPVTGLLGRDVRVEDVRRIRPNGVRDAVLPMFVERWDRVERARRLAGSAPIADETSRKVAAQYETNPYPRWTCLSARSTPARWRETLLRHFPAERLAFMDAPFELLIAGCGTGRQAIEASFAYGPNARITAIDISAASLAYAERMAETFGAKNIEFRQADILELGTDFEFSNRFKIIECAGVLHHMRDPLEGWRALERAMAEGGMMLIALYSEIARARLTDLKKDPDYPGEGCSDAALRAYRRTLLDRPEGTLGAEFRGIRDLYTTSGFRDLVLHVSERRFTIPEIGKFLDDEGLAFRGFFNPQDFERLRQRFPDETWPGRLDRWAYLEAANPSLFQAMYYFWCDRA